MSVGISYIKKSLYSSHMPKMTTTSCDVLPVKRIII